MSFVAPPNMAELTEQSLQRLGERKFLVFDGVEYTNAQLLDRARRLHGALKELNFGQGSKALMCLMNSANVYPIFDALFRSGGASIPVMFTLTAAQLRFVIADSGVEGIFTDPVNLEKVLAALEGIDTVRWVIVDGEFNVEAPKNIVLHRLEELFNSAPEQEIPTIARDELAMMLYTSGTTGTPKGVMLSHANLLANTASSYANFEYDLWEGPRVLYTALPMAHVFGVGAMSSGYTVPAHFDYYSVQARWFEPLAALQAIDQYQATFTAMVPAMLNALLNHPETEKYSKDSLVEVIVGGSPLPPELAHRVHNEWGTRVREGYGLTECAASATSNLRSNPYREGSCGLPCKDCEIAITDDEGNRLAPFVRGEVLLRGPTVMMGYYNNDEATAKTLKGGWLHTGDIGYLDEDGYLFLVDRKKDMILKSGENIYPAELEAILYQHPAVLEAAIVGKPDDKHGEVVVAFVVLKPGKEASTDHLVSFMAEHMEKFKLPAEVYFREELPKAGTGKILRRELRDELGAE